MLTLNADRFVKLLRIAADIERVSAGHTGNLSDGDRETMKDAGDKLGNMLRDIDLPVSEKAAMHLLPVADTHEKANRAMEQVFNTIEFELEGRRFHGPVRRYQQYFEQPKLFGEEVFKAFSSANDDIFEAGTCLALERGTACVMHLMRVVEAGLKALARKLEIGQQNDWGSYLRKIDEELARRLKAAGKRTPDEQFYAEARLMLDSVRVAWRNPTMHIENSYAPERAEEILIAVRSLMRHLATNVSEWSSTWDESQRS